jgi:DHA1 family bicyclomycin/chloramphenicol resistance-like MFS transporter
MHLMLASASGRAQWRPPVLNGGLPFLVGAAVTPLTGVLGYTSLRPMALLMCGFMTLAWTALALTR